MSGQPPGTGFWTLRLGGLGWGAAVLRRCASPRGHPHPTCQHLLEKKHEGEWGLETTLRFLTAPNGNGLNAPQMRSDCIVF